MNFIIKIFLSISLFLIISSFGLPIIFDLLLSFLIIYFIKSNIFVFFIFNFLLITLTFSFNILLIKNLKEEDLFYRAHEKFIDKDAIYRKNISSVMTMPYGDIIPNAICKIERDIIEPRVQKFITDKYGFRNDKVNIEDADIILVGDSFVAGSSNSQEDIPSNIFSNFSEKKISAITVIQGPDYYNMHLERNLKNFSKHAEILLFYFAGNDFHYEFKKNKKFIFYQGIPIPYLKYKIRFGYERLERNKDKFFMKIFSKLYNKNFFYKKIRPKSQRLTKSMLANWTKTCPVEYHYINKIKVGFYYKPPTNFISVRTHIITNDEILKKIKKIYYIPTKFQVYSKHINNEEIKNDDYKYLKLNYEKLGIEVEDLTDILVKSADINLKNNKLIYWKDDTHWNKIGITTVIKHIAKQF
jgi:hypothetical protein